jgi:hypothetical protein
VDPLVRVGLLSISRLLLSTNEFRDPGFTILQKKPTLRKRCLRKAPPQGVFRETLFGRRAGDLRFAGQVTDRFLFVFYLAQSRNFGCRIAKDRDDPAGYVG